MFTLSTPFEYLSPLSWWFFNALAIAWLVFLLCLPSTRAALRLPLRQNLSLIVSFLLVVLWLTRAQTLENLHLHLLGANLAFMLLGAPLAMCVLAVVLLMVDVTLGVPLIQFGVQFFLSVALPVGAALLLHALASRFLPRRLFAFIFVQGFFVAALSMLFTAGVNLLALKYLGWIALGLGNEVFWLSPVLLAWGEGLLSGMMAALICTYQPHWWFKKQEWTDF